MIEQREQIGAALVLQADSFTDLPEYCAGQEPFDCLLTDPPYSSGGMTRGDRMQKTSAKYQTSTHAGIYAEFAGDTRDQRGYTLWTALWLARALPFLREGALVGLFTDWRQLPATTDALQAAGVVWRGIVPWDKTEASRPQLGRYRHQCEYIVWGTKGLAPLTGPVAPGLFRMSANCEQKEHIAAKPARLMVELLQIAGRRVLDPFMGTAPIGEACIITGREYVGAEIVPDTYTLARDRLLGVQSQAGMFPIAPVAGQLFEATA